MQSLIHMSQDVAREAEILLDNDQAATSDSQLGQGQGQSASMKLASNAANAAVKA